MYYSGAQCFCSLSDGAEPEVLSFQDKDGLGRRRVLGVRGQSCRTAPSCHKITAFKKIKLLHLGQYGYYYFIVEESEVTLFIYEFLVRCSFHFLTQRSASYPRDRPGSPQYSVHSWGWGCFLSPPITLRCQPEHLLWFLQHLGSAGGERAGSRVHTVSFPKREGRRHFRVRLVPGTLLDTGVPPPLLPL